MRKILALSIMAATSVQADTQEFHSNSAFNFTTSHESLSCYQAQLNSSTAISTGPCGVVPPPTVCTRPPILASSTTTIPNYTRQESRITTYYFGAGMKTYVDPTSLLALLLPPAVSPPNPTKEWPGVRGVGVYFTIPTSKYVSAAFTVPVGYFATQPVNVYGFYSVNEQQNQAPVSMTISTSCGDFSSPSLAGSTVVPGCIFNKATSGEGVFWKANGPTCAITSGGIYYFNAINADISHLTPNGGGSAASTKNGVGTNCAAYSCQISIVNGPGNWTNP